jgi:hypothetical protein
VNVASGDLNSSSVNPSSGGLNPSSRTPELQFSPPLNPSSAKPEKKKHTQSEGRLDEFEVFWNAYPRRIGKGDALKAWMKRNGSLPGLDVVLKAIESARQSDQWQKENGRFIPYPATWLNRGSWADEYSTSVPAERKVQY